MKYKEAYWNPIEIAWNPIEILEILLKSFELKTSPIDKWEILVKDAKSYWNPIEIKKNLIEIREFLLQSNTRYPIEIERNPIEIRKILLKYDKSYRKTQNPMDILWKYKEIPIEVLEILVKPYWNREKRYWKTREPTEILLK